MAGKVCEICGNEYENYIGLVLHIRQKHKIVVKEYYDKYFLNLGDNICKKCGGKTTFFGIGVGYGKHCSYTCSNSNTEVMNKKKETLLERYGEDSPLKILVFKEKAKLTCLDRYGFENAFGAEEIKRKIKLTCLERYGVENPKQAEIIKEREIKHSLEKYGVSHYRKTKKWRQKMKEIMKQGQAAYMCSCNKNLSKQQIILYNKIKSIYADAILNYICLNYVIDVVIPSKNIAIEYDGSYWHQDKEKDEIRQITLEKEGWKFIRYTDYIPSKEELIKTIGQRS